MQTHSEDDYSGRSSKWNLTDETSGRVWDTESNVTDTRAAELIVLDNLSGLNSIFVMHNYALRCILERL